MLLEALRLLYGFFCPDGLFHPTGSEYPRLPPPATEIWRPSGRRSALIT